MFEDVNIRFVTNFTSTDPYLYTNIRVRLQDMFCIDNFSELKEYQNTQVAWNTYWVEFSRTCVSESAKEVDSHINWVADRFIASQQGHFKLYPNSWLTDKIIPNMPNYAIIAETRYYCGVHSHHSYFVTDEMKEKIDKLAVIDMLKS